MDLPTVPAVMLNKTEKKVKIKYKTTGNNACIRAYSSHADIKMDVAKTAGYCLLVLLPPTLALPGLDYLQSLVLSAQFLQTNLQLQDAPLIRSILIQHRFVLIL